MAGLEKKGNLDVIDMNPQPPNVKTGEVIAFPNMLSAALAYASVGIPIFPLRPTEKKALITGWQKLATTNERQIREWFREYPRMRIATVAGKRSGIVNCDLDRKNGIDGPATLDEMARFLGLPRGVTVTTPSGGQHRYFRMPSGVSVYNRVGDIAPGIDVRGSRADGSKGGIIPLPPSPGPAGSAYLFDWQGIKPEDLRNLPELPPWLLYFMIFNKAQRARLIALGIHGPGSFEGATPDRWEAIGREKLRAELRVKAGGCVDNVLPADVHERLVRYVRKGIADECGVVEQAPPLSRDITINNGALKIWSLLKGLEDWIGETPELDEITGEARNRFLEAASKLGDDEKDGPFIDIAAEKWERNEDDAEARDLSHKAQPRSGADDDFRELYEKPATGKLLEYPSDISLDDIRTRQANALIKGHVHPGEMGMLYGETTAGKTFIALDAAWHIALGRDWHGLKVKQAPMLYVALEGVAGFRKRVLALRTDIGEPGKQLSRLAIHVSLVRSKAGAIGADLVVKAAQQLGADAGKPVGLIVIDTMARAMAGDDENDAGDMMHFIEQRAGHIARATGAAVLIVHHPNKAGNSRGSTAAPAGLEFIWRIDRTGSKRTLVGEKVKDGAEGPMFDFQLRPVLLGVDDDGDAIDTCVVQSAPASPAPVKPAAVPKHIRVFHDAFAAALEAGHAVEARVEQAKVRDAFMKLYPVADTEPDRAKATRERMWRKAFKDLSDEYELGEIGGVVRLWLKTFQPPFNQET